MKNNASLLYGFFLIVGDSLALIAAFVSAYILRVKLDERPLVAEIAAREYLEASLVIIPIWLIIFGLLALYNRNTYENRFSEFGRLLVGCFLGILVAIGYEYVTDITIFPARLVPVYVLGLSFAFVLLFRTVARGIRRSLFSFGVGVNHVLIVGDTSVTDEFIQGIGNTRVTGYKVVGIVGNRKKSDKYQHFSNFSAAVKALEKIGVHSVIQTELYADSARNAEILSYTQENHIAYRFVPGNSELFSGSIDVDLFYSIPVIAVHQTALTGWGRIVKRLFDIVISAAAIVLLSPLMLIIWLLLMLSGGQPIYRRSRVTRYNNSFKIYKFRSLKKAYNGLDPEEGFAKMGKPELAKQFRANGDYLENDPRISRFGNFIRKTSLDELPQLFNVLKGDISLVGPRALIQEELDAYEKKNLILTVKSGLTGLAVISGRRDIPFEERRKLDLYYVQNWSFWNDIVILAKTAAVILFGRGAK